MTDPDNNNQDHLRSTNAGAPPPAEKSSAVPSADLPDFADPTPTISMGLDVAKATHEALKEGRRPGASDTTEPGKDRIQDVLQRQRRRPQENEEARQLEIPLEDEGAPERQNRPDPRRVKTPQGAQPKRMKVAPQPQKRMIKSRRNLERARRRQMNYLQKRREQKKMRVFYGRIRSTFKFFFAILWLVLLWEAVHSEIWALDAPRFNVVQQRDEHLLQPIQFERLVKTQLGKPLFAIDTGKLASEFRHEWKMIDSVSVRRLMFPTRLEIVVLEKKPWAELYSNIRVVQPKAPDTEEKKPVESALQATAKTSSAPVLVTATKTPALPPVIVSKPYAILSEQFDVVNLNKYKYTPESFESEKPTRLLVTPGKPLSKSFLRDLEVIDYQLRTIPGLHFMWLDVRNPNVVTAQFEETQVVIGRLDVEASQRLARIIPLLPKIREFNAVIEAVDLRWSQQVTFRKKATAVIKPPRDDKIDG